MAGLAPRALRSGGACYTGAVRKPIVFFDLGWTLEDEEEAQIHRARSASAALARRGIHATPERGHLRAP